MGGILMRYRWLLGGALLAAAGTAAYFARPQQTVRGQTSVLVLQAGSESAPVVGLALGGEARAFVQALGPTKPTPPGALRLERAQNVFFSSTWTKRALVEVRDGKTQVELPSGNHTTLGGEYWFELDSSGRIVVAVPEAPRSDGEHELLVLGEDGGVLATVETPEPLWVAVAGLGRRIAIGTASGVRVVERGGQQVSSYSGESESGALSEDGEWLAFEQSTDAEPRLVITRADAGEREAAVAGLEEVGAQELARENYPFAHKVYEEILAIDPECERAKETIDEIKSGELARKKALWRKLKTRAILALCALAALGALAHEILARRAYVEVQQEVARRGLIESGHYADALALYTEMQASFPWATVSLYDARQQISDLEAKLATSAVQRNGP